MPNGDKLLLLAGSVPGDAHVGEVILRDLCRPLVSSQLCIFAVAEPAADESVRRASQSWSVESTHQRFERGWYPMPGFPGQIASAVATCGKFRPRMRQLQKEVVRFAKAQQVRRVWAVLDAPSLIALAAPVARELGLPLSVLVWDAPEHLAAVRRLDRFSQRRLLRDFADAMSQADRCAVVGESMKQVFDTQFAKECIILRHGLPVPEEAAVEPPRNANQFVIGFGGSISAPDALQALIQTLDSSHWRIGDRDAVLKFVGAQFLVKAQSSQHIVSYGRRSVEETRRILGECDVLYLPQPFDPRQRPLAEYSFPTKLSTYLAARRPVLLHAPEYASVVPFWRRFPFGSWVNSLDSSAIVRALTELGNDDRLIHQSIVAGQRAVNEELNAGVFQQRFRELVHSVT